MSFMAKSPGGVRLFQQLHRGGEPPDNYYSSGDESPQDHLSTLRHTQHISDRQRAPIHLSRIY